MRPGQSGRHGFYGTKFHTARNSPQVLKLTQEQSHAKSNPKACLNTHVYPPLPTLVSLLLCRRVLCHCALEENTLVLQAGFYGGSCSGVSFLGPGTCDLSCGRCTKCPDYNYCKYCTDSPPDSTYTCAQQVCAYMNLHQGMQGQISQEYVQYTISPSHSYL